MFHQQLCKQDLIQSRGTGLSPEEYILMGREDLAATLICLNEPKPTTTTRPSTTQPAWSPQMPSVSPGAYPPSIADTGTLLSPHTSLHTPRFGPSPLPSDSTGSLRSASPGLFASVGAMGSRDWQAIIAGSRAPASEPQALHYEWHSRYVPLHA
jgi:hypothetical protein